MLINCPLNEQYQKMCTLKAATSHSASLRPSGSGIILYYHFQI